MSSNLCAFVRDSFIAVSPREKILWFIPCVLCEPCERKFIWLSSQALRVAEAKTVHEFRIVEVAAVRQYRLFQQLLHTVEIRAAEFVPLGADRQRVRALQRVVGILHE
jgi:hypothetical protein